MQQPGPRAHLIGSPTRRMVAACSTSAARLRRLEILKKYPGLWLYCSLLMMVWAASSRTGMGRVLKFAGMAGRGGGPRPIWTSSSVEHCLMALSCRQGAGGGSA